MTAILPPVVVFIFKDKELYYLNSIIEGTRIRINIKGRQTGRQAYVPSDPAAYIN